MGSSGTQPRDWREWRRMRALDLAQQDWKQRDISVALDASEGAVSRWLAAARCGGRVALRSHRLSGNNRLCFPVLEGDLRLGEIWLQEFEHPMNRTDLDHCFARIGVPLIVPTVPPVAAQPGERPLHDPAAGQLHEPRRTGGTLHDLDPVPYLRLLLQPGVQTVVVVF